MSSHCGKQPHTRNKKIRLPLSSLVVLVVVITCGDIKSEVVVRGNYWQWRKNHLSGVEAH